MIHNAANSHHFPYVWARPTLGAVLKNAQSRYALLPCRSRAPSMVPAAISVIVAVKETVVKYSGQTTTKSCKRRRKKQMKRTTPKQESRHAPDPDRSRVCTGEGNYDELGIKHQVNSHLSIDLDRRFWPSTASWHRYPLILVMAVARWPVTQRTKPTQPCCEVWLSHFMKAPWSW